MLSSYSTMLSMATDGQRLRSTCLGEQTITLRTITTPPWEERWSSKPDKLELSVYTPASPTEFFLNNKGSGINRKCSSMKTNLRNHISITCLHQKETSTSTWLLTPLWKTSRTDNATTAKNKAIKARTKRCAALQLRLPRFHNFNARAKSRLTKTSELQDLQKSLDLLTRTLILRQALFPSRRT